MLTGALPYSVSFLPSPEFYKRFRLSLLYCRGSAELRPVYHPPFDLPQSSFVCRVQSVDDSIYDRPAGIHRFLILSEYCDMILGGYCRISLGWLYHIMTSPAIQLTTLQDCPFGRNFARQFCNFTRQICKFAGNSPKRGTIYDKPIKKSRRRERKNL